MQMSETTLYIFEALTDIGVKPEKALQVERAFESARHFDQSHVQESILGRVMTREDGLRLEQKFEARFSKIEGTQLVHSWMLGLIVAGIVALVMKAFFQG
ncbi:MAG: hypothetical protein FWG56_01870 [Desulfovibrionaceae bacterium]|jgi:reverse gyrase|nr:hypothetical protein [Desulfovibrionaceae bacterium]